MVAYFVCLPDRTAGQYSKCEGRKWEGQQRHGKSFLLRNKACECPQAWRAPRERSVEGRFGGNGLHVTTEQGQLCGNFGRCLESQSSLSFFSSFKNMY